MAQNSNPAYRARQGRIERARRDAIRALQFSDLTTDEIARTWVTEMARMLAAGRPIDWVATVVFIQRMNAKLTDPADIAGATRALRIVTELAAQEA